MLEKENTALSFSRLRVFFRGMSCRNEKNVRQKCKRRSRVVDHNSNDEESSDSGSSFSFGDSSGSNESAHIRRRAELLTGSSSEDNFSEDNSFASTDSFSGSTNNSTSYLSSSCSSSCSTGSSTNSSSSSDSPVPAKSPSKLHKRIPFIGIRTNKNVIRDTRRPTLFTVRPPSAHDDVSDMSTNRKSTSKFFISAAAETIGRAREAVESCRREMLKAHPDKGGPGGDAFRLAVSNFRAAKRFVRELENDKNEKKDESLKCHPKTQRRK